MNCPTCPDATLAITERVGVEIDYCPVCRGVWLDRGELDKILARTGDAPTDASRRDNRPPQSDRRARDDDRDGGRDDDDVWGNPRADRSGRRRKRSMFAELFDF